MEKFLLQDERNQKWVQNQQSNKPIKQAFKKSYVSFKLKNDPGPGGKYKISRDDIFSWLEIAVEDFNEKMGPSEAIGKAFGCYGQDFRTTDTTALMSYLGKWEEDGIYRSLISNQTTLDVSE